MHAVGICLFIVFIALLRRIVWKRIKQNKTKQSRQRFAMIKLNSAKNISLTDSKAEIELTLDELRNHTDLLYCPKVAVTFRRWSGHNIKHVTMVIAV